MSVDEFHAPGGVLVQNEVATRDREQWSTSVLGLGCEHVGEECLGPGHDRQRARQSWKMVPGCGCAYSGGGDFEDRCSTFGSQRRWVPSESVVVPQRTYASSASGASSERGARRL